MLLVNQNGTQVKFQESLNATKLQSLSNQTEGGIGWLINVFTGGAFSEASIFALGIMPYISASKAPPVNTLINQPIPPSV